MSILLVRFLKLFLKENSNYLLPWLVTVSISAIYAFVTSVYYMVYEVNRKAPFGIAVFILTRKFNPNFTKTTWFHSWFLVPSILGVICVINHYYQLEGSGHKKHQKTATTGVNTEISSASLPSDMVDEHNGAPPPYTSIFVNSETQLKGCANDREKQPEYYRGIYVGEDTTVGAAGSDDKRRF